MEAHADVAHADLVPREKDAATQAHFPCNGMRHRRQQRQDASNENSYNFGDKRDLRYQPATAVKPPHPHVASSQPLPNTHESHERQRGRDNATRTKHINNVQSLDLLLARPSYGVWSLP